MRLALLSKTGLAVGGIVVATCMTTGIPSASAVVDAECFGEVRPREAAAGTTGQAFSVEVFHGPELPAPLPVEELNYLQIFPPVELAAANSASAPSPWEERIVGPPPAAVRYQGGEIQLGDSETFSITADLADTPGAEDRWSIRVSRDGGDTMHPCSAIQPGALDMTLI